MTDRIIKRSRSSRTQEQPNSAEHLTTELKAELKRKEQLHRSLCKQYGDSGDVRQQIADIEEALRKLQN